MVSTWIKKTKTKDISFSTQKIFIFFGHVEQSFGKFVKRDCKSCRKMLDIEDMKKFIILAIVLVFVFGGGIGIYIGFTKQNKDNFNAESENKSKEIEKFVEVEDPFVLAKEKLTLVLCDKTANVCASVYNADNTNLKFSEFDNNIIEIDSLGNVKPLQVGETSIKSFVEIGDKKYSYTTKVVVLPLEIEAEINLVDENENSVTNPLLGEKYTLKLTSVNLKFYDLNLIASDHVKVSNDKTLDNCRSCDVYFESKAEHSLQFKLVLDADNMKHTFFLDKLVVDNSEKVPDVSKDDDSKPSDPDKPTEPDTPDEPIDNPDDPIDNPDYPVDDPSEDASSDDDNDPIEDKPVDDKPDIPVKKVFTLSSSAKDIEITDSTIRISGFTKEKLVALAFKIIDSTKKYSIRFEILEGNNINVEIETSMIGLEILSKGTLKLRLYTLEDPSLSQTFTIIVEWFQNNGFTATKKRALVALFFVF